MARRKNLWMAVLSAATAVAVVGGSAVAYEEPEYTLIKTVNGVEYRQYRPYLIAETRISGQPDRDKAANAGFRRLFRYISGENILRRTVANEASGSPASASTKISMTTPVWQAPADDGWSVAFVVPKEYDVSSVPLPTSAEVSIRTVPGLLTAVWKYSGRWTEQTVRSNETELLDRLADSGIRPAGEVVTAYYNSPFTPPFLRRNEVQVQVNQVPE